jgi:hypothetical protein
MRRMLPTPLMRRTLPTPLMRRTRHILRIPHMSLEPYEKAV